MKKPSLVKYFVCIIFSTLLIAACSTAYQPGVNSAGYSDTKLDDNMYLVSFRGNGYTENQKAVDFCLLRCSELCLKNGFNYFVIVGNKELIENSTYSTPTDLEERIAVVGSVTRTHLSLRGETYTFSKPSVSNTIVCFKDKPKETCYNANIVMKSVKEKYGID